MYSFKIRLTDLKNQTVEALEGMRQKMESCLTSKGHNVDVDILSDEIKLSDLDWDFSDSFEIQLMYNDLKITTNIKELEDMIMSYKENWGLDTNTKLTNEEMEALTNSKRAIAIEGNKNENRIMRLIRRFM